ncbi:MAG: hypothetical protein Q8S13_02210, partial [Dehalococcoidia bacterium]|nr:hypothetical protein [Dehalococcoidia bacterium]
ERLRAADALSLAAIARLSEAELAELVRPAGTPAAKARRLRALAQLAHERGGLQRLLALPPDDLRPLLLATYGVGPETADAILLYAAGRPVFLIDAYTQRIFRRLDLGPDGDGYARWQRWFEDVLAPSPLAASGGRGEGGLVDAYRRYHALIVLHGKRTCRPRPRCDACCLLDLCPTGREQTGVAAG